MAQKMKMNKQLEAPLLPLVPVKKNKKKPAVVFASQWGLLNAGIVALTLAFLHILSVYTNACQLVHPDLTDAEVAKANALLLGFFCCSVPQAAAGTLVLLLAAHRRGTRRALAYVVLAAAVTGHCMFAGAGGIFLTAGLGYLFMIITSLTIFEFAMIDLHVFLALMGSEG